MRYSVVLFDVGETLVGPRESFGAVYARVLEGHGLLLGADLLERSIREVIAEVSHEIPRGTDRYAYYPGGESEYWLRFSRRTLEKATGKAVDGDLPRRALDGLRDAFLVPDAWEVFADVVPTLDALRREGVRLGVVSNWDSRLPEVLRVLELDRHFEVVGVSHFEGVEKPEPALFRRVLEKMEARPEEALHVGDIPELDLAGARAAGLDALLVDRRGRLDADHEALRDLSPLPAIVRGEA